jgi:hypothetical protein
MARQQGQVVVRRDPEVHAAFPVAQRRWRVAGIFKGPIALLQEQAVLWIHVLRFLRRDAEEERIEAIDVVHRAEPFGARFPGLAIRSCTGSHPPRRRHLRHAIPALNEILPILVEIVRLRIPAGHPDDRDSLVRLRAAPVVCRRAGLLPSAGRGAAAGPASRPALQVGLQFLDVSSSCWSASEAHGRSGSRKP